MEHRCLVVDYLPVCSPGQIGFRVGRGEGMRLRAGAGGRKHEQAPPLLAQNRCQYATIRRDAQIGVVICIARNRRNQAVRVGDQRDLGSLVIGTRPARQSEQPPPVRQPRWRLKELLAAAEEHLLPRAGDIDRDQALPDIGRMQLTTDNHLSVRRPGR